MSAATDSLALLERIAVACERLVTIAERRQQSTTGSGPAVATDRDLDGKYGDPEVRMRVRDWSGPDMKGRHFSQCPAEFLDLLAETMDWAASKDAESGDPEKVKYAKYKRVDASRARGWSARIRSGKHQQEPVGATASTGAGSSDEWAGGGEW